MTVVTVGLVGYSTYAYLVPVTNGHLVELNKEVTNGLLPTCGTYFSHDITTCVKVFLNTLRHIWTLLTHRHATIFARDGASRSRLDVQGDEV